MTEKISIIFFAINYFIGYSCGRTPSNHFDLCKYTGFDGQSLVIRTVFSSIYLSRFSHRFFSLTQDIHFQFRTEIGVLIHHKTWQNLTFINNEHWNRTCVSRALTVVKLPSWFPLKSCLVTLSQSLGPKCIAGKVHQIGHHNDYCNQIMANCHKCFREDFFYFRSFHFSDTKDLWFYDFRILLELLNQLSMWPWPKLW